MIRFKFRAIKDRNFFDGEPCFRKGEIYAVEDGKITFAGGWTSNVSADTFEEFMKCNPDFKGHIVEIRDIDTTKKYKGYEIIEMLYKHELQEGDTISFRDGILKEEYSIAHCTDTLSLRDKDDVEVANSLLTCPDGEFTITLYVEKVDFITAWKAYLEGKKIKSFNGWAYQNGKMFDIDGITRVEFSIRKEELEREWVIIDD